VALWNSDVMCAGVTRLALLLCYCPEVMHLILFDCTLLYDNNQYFNTRCEISESTSND
jgi:hypothetical protein